MASFTAGTTFVDGVSNDVTAAKLGNLVTNATPTSGFIQDRTAETVTATNDTLLIGDASDSNNLKRITVANFAQTLPTAKVTTGTIETGTFGTTTSTAATITTLTAGTTTSTAATITTGTIPTLVATTLITTGTGTAAAPAIVPTGDTNTGLFFPAADTIAFSEGGAEAMRIDSSGNVGIGTASPSAKLNVNGTLTVSGTITSSASIILTGSESSPLGISTGDSGTGLIELYGGATNKGGTIQFRGGGNSGDLRFLTGTTGTGTERLRIDSSGGVTIAGLAGSGSRAVNASAAGLLSAASDASLKEEVVGAHIAGLDEILQIHPKMYRWKDDIANRGENASVELGFIANDVAPIIPSAAPMGNDGLYGFYDRSITAALVKAVQELKAENDSLKSRIEALEAK
jgi:hypothetical protein